MAEELGRIDINKIFSRGGGMPVQTNQVVAPSQDQMMANPYQEQPRNPFIKGLGMIAMGIGEGMTGRPFLTNFANNLYEQKQAQLKYRQWQEEQKIAQQKADIDMLAKMQGTEISYPDPTTGKLITTRMSGLELPQEITSPVYQRLGVKNPSSLSQPSSGITPPEGFMAVKEGGKTKFVKVSDPKDVASMADSKKKEQMQVEGLRLAAQDTLDTISEIKNGKGNFGVFGDVPSIPGTQRKNWEANVDKLKSQRIIDLMAQMKAVSKTGATGFGQLSEKELKVLQDASTAFQRGLSQKDALKYLNKMESMARKVLTDEKNPMATMSNEELQSIIDNAKAK